MIVYRDIVQKLLEPMALALQLPLLDVTQVKPDSPTPCIAYEVPKPYEDMTPHMDRTKVTVEKVVEMEWQLLLIGQDRLDLMQRCRELMRWLWSEGEEQAKLVPTTIVKMMPPEWKKEPIPSLTLTVRLRMKDSWQQANSEKIEKINIQMKE
ncbi:hypothetical protein FPZ44_01010 [Paenibacillus agilis]|uniref:Uncharacterized protein n=1 Tax=Paenibacillus agilis TaxID=3020863 RepID=A0A559IVU4_9BACL|nr:hypothetical protein [Paenibacillus agilis]TVX91760.1 hypothetical protein FPZ44_01010 [Paenibacillus agilis]